MSKEADPRILYAYAIGSNPLLEGGIESGNVVVGRLRVFKKWANALSFCRSPLFPCDVVLNSHELRGNAYDGDVVAVELLPRSYWSEPIPEAPEADHEESGAAGKTAGPSRDLPMYNLLQPENEEAALERAPREVWFGKKLKMPPLAERWDGLRPVGRVVAVLHRDKSALVAARIVSGVLKDGEEVRSDYYYRFRSVDPLMPMLAVQGRNIPVQYHDRIESSLFALRIACDNYGNPIISPNTKDIVLCTVERFLGGAMSADANCAALCAASSIQCRNFTQQEEDCIPASLDIPSREELPAAFPDRRDLRDDEFICTIDPSTARDLDDALSIRRRPDGGYHVGVHIADVSHFVKPGTALDAVAKERSTSVYLVDRVIPMLPSKLSEHYCSLNPSEDKFAFSVLLEFDRHGELLRGGPLGGVQEWFGQSVIRSRCRLAYEQAQQILDDDNAVKIDVKKESELTGESEESLVAQVKKSVKLLYELASMLRKKSLASGRLTIGNRRLGFYLDTEDDSSGTPSTVPVGIRLWEQISANWVVEEFMLLANFRTAEKIVQFIPKGAILRAHPAPERKKMKAFGEALRQHGLTFFGSKGVELQRTMDQVKAMNTKEEYYDVCDILKYAMTAAAYICNDPEVEMVRSHFAIAAAWYTHFTSPIRRYCDVIAHRQLQIALELERYLVKHVADPTLRPSDAELDQLLCSIDPASLDTRDLFLSPSEVEEVALHANTCRLNARSAGDASIGFFFALYLDAVNKMSSAGGSSFYPFLCKGTVVRLMEKSVTVYVAEVALEVEVAAKEGGGQRFTLAPAPVKGTSDSASDASDDSDYHDHAAEKVIDKKQKAHLRSKGGKNNMPSGPRGQAQESAPKASPGLWFSWGVGPETGETVKERIELFSPLVVEISVATRDGLMEPMVVILPPWERERYTGKPVLNSLVANNKQDATCTDFMELDAVDF